MLLRVLSKGLNVATELVVKTTLSDRVVWYKAWHDDIRIPKRYDTMSVPVLQ